MTFIKEYYQEKRARHDVKYRNKYVMKRMSIYDNYLTLDGIRSRLIIASYYALMDKDFAECFRGYIRNPRLYKENQNLVVPIKEFDVRKALDIFYDLQDLRWEEPIEQFNIFVQIIIDNDRKAELGRSVFIRYCDNLKEKRAKYGAGSVLDVFSTLNQPYFFPQYSPHPFMVATGLYLTVSNFIHWLWFSSGHGWGAFICFLFTVYAIAYWFRDLCIESSYLLKHTTYDNRKFKFAFFLFLASEVMFFWSFFWAFFHSSLAPGVGIGFVWPPYYIHPIPWYGLPLANTGLLVGSGCFAAALTTTLKTRLPLKKHTRYEWFYLINYAFNLPWRERFRVPSRFYLDAIYNIWLFKKVGHKLYCISLGYWKFILIYGGVFVLFQFYEYYVAPFSINSGIYGSCFFLITGLHGLHVIAGWLFLFIQRFRYLRKGFRVENYLGIRMAIWYWHFVDIIWILVMFWVYWWGS